mgnify:CR=1 FL=1
MKPAQLVAVTASIVAVVATLGLQFIFDTSRSGIAESELQQLNKTVLANRDSMSLLRSDLQELRQLLHVQTAGATPPRRPSADPSVDVALTDRLDAIEQRLSQVLTAQHMSPAQRKESLKSQLRDRVSSPDASANAAYLAAESHFESDSGKPLGDYPDRIKDSLHLVDGIDLKGVDCLDTICRITYATSSSLTESEQQTATTAIEDSLLFGAEGRVVELRYASDSSGNRVIYAQIK